MKTAAAALLMLFATSSAMALDTATDPGAADPHIRRVAYNPLNRVLLLGQIGRQTTIIYDPGERVIRAVFGIGEGSKDDPWEGPDPATLEKQPLYNVLFLWPHKTTPENLMVTTIVERTGERRVYQYALRASNFGEDGEDDPAAIFGLVYQYPADVKAAAAEVAADTKKAQAASWKTAKLAKDAAVAKARLSIDATQGTLNKAYIARPNTAWRNRGWPKPGVFDNGMVTAFEFVGNVAEPAIYIVDIADEDTHKECRTGSEGSTRLAPWHDQGNLKVITTTAPHFRLMLGDAVMEVCNYAWDGGVGKNPGTGTASPDVIRELVVAK